MPFKIYAKSEFFQNSCMKRDQNYLLNTVFLNPNYFSLYQDKLVLLLVCFCFALFSFFQMHEFKHTITFFLSCKVKV